MKKGDVISLEFEKGSFSWANGLKVIIKIIGTDVYICSLNDKGAPSMVEGEPDKYSVAITGISNPAIKPTKLFMEIEKEPKTN